MRFLQWLGYCPLFPVKMGDSGPHLAVAFAAIGLLIGLVRASEWKLRADFLSISMLLLLAALLVSSALSGLYSGAAVGTGSIVRVLLFGIAIYCFFYIRNGPVW